MKILPKNQSVGKNINFDKKKRKIVSKKSIIWSKIVILLKK